MPSVIGEIRKKWLALGGEKSVLGKPLTDELKTPDGIGRFNRFQGGFIYWTPKTGAHEIHGAIRDKWAALGFEESWLGYPISDEEKFPEGGRVSSFQRGAIYWWPDTGAIELNDVIVHYTGLVCFRETTSDQGSNSDEPYAILGVISPAGTLATRTRVYEDVDDGESRPDLLEIYRGKPRGLTISTLLMEHDSDNPDEYKAAMKSAVAIAFKGIEFAIELIPVAGPVISTIAAPLLAAVAPAVSDELHKALDLGDDKIGEVTLALSAKQMVVLAARTGNSVERGVGFKISTPLLSAHGADYKVYFGVVPA